MTRAAMMTPLCASRGDQRRRRGLTQFSCQPPTTTRPERDSFSREADTFRISRLFRVGRLANIRPVGSDRVLRGRGCAARGSHDITKQGPSANSEACGGCVDPCGRVITTLLSEPRVRNGP